MSEKLDKFERLAEKRVTETIKKIRLVGNLANKNNYEYSEEHAKKIIETLDDEMRLLKSRFKEELQKESKSFSFRK
ncbi:hypothetical protein GCM10011351_26970 [Paraliobacillus quinghaiensis]|uniref:Uncharacterized protein n=1 Tax=Paraliobacillus quinghaiensis TaxID=470815 RepID=A0A917WWJ1_9BACI|nr:hypothetical protein [Paraliobacillus quinghaiensis]GGM39425.1 hypothetical protein GCM10011351_26970 [Paraliobacillus quinghaiensis]